MSALEEIEKAIEKLTKLSKAAPGAPWVSDYEFDDEPLLRGSDALGNRFSNEFATLDNPAAGNLIVTLHRTIDAQLRILQTAIADIVRWTDADSEWGWEPQDGPTPKDSTFIAKLDLARAINGTTS